MKKNYKTEYARPGTDIYPQEATRFYWDIPCTFIGIGTKEYFVTDLAKIDKELEKMEKEEINNYQLKYPNNTKLLVRKKIADKTISYSRIKIFNNYTLYFINPDNNKIIGYRAILVTENKKITIRDILKAILEHIKWIFKPNNPSKGFYRCGLRYDIKQILYLITRLVKIRSK